MTQGLYRSTVDEDRVHKMSNQYGGDTPKAFHEAFLRLIFYLVTGFGYSDLEPEDIIDGHGEYQSPTQFARAVKEASHPSF